MKGEVFENLVEWITKCIHTHAVVTKNDKLVDIHTKRKRQIDISIRIKDGPTDVLGIVEARDRSRPVGVEYIEQVNSKKVSVAADFCVIVSNKGFHKTAISKAQQLNIRLISIDDALKINWSFTIKGAKFFKEIMHLEDAIIYFIDKAENRIIDPHPRVIQQIEKFGSKFLILQNKSGEPLVSLNDLMQPVRNIIERVIGKGIEMKKKIALYFDFQTEEALYLVDQNNISRLI